MNLALVVLAKSTNNAMVSSIKHVQVAVGVVEKDDKFFVCRRQAHQHQANKWEFAGGKIDAGETPLHALTRELLEEIAIQVKSASPLMVIDFSYPDKNVSLHVFLVNTFSGHAQGAEGQQTKWVTLADLFLLDLPAANSQIVEKLALLYKK